MQHNSTNIMVDTNEQETVAKIVDQFLDQWCDQGRNLRVTERALFAKFRVFWGQTTDKWIHEAPFNEFHTALKSRGFRPTSTGRRYWYGLRLLRTKRKEEHL
jgi:hypothetical protein